VLEEEKDELELSELVLFTTVELLLLEELDFIIKVLVEEDFEEDLDELLDIISVLEELEELELFTTVLCELLELDLLEEDDLLE